MRDPTRRLPTTLVLLTLACLSRAAYKTDFSTYPTNSQTCLSQSSSTSGCSGDTETAVNSCLCNNGGNFITNTASCLGKSDPSDLLSVYLTLSTACSDSATPINVAQAQYLSAAGVSTFFSSTTSKSTSTRSSNTLTTGTMTTTGTGSGGPSATGKSDGDDDGGGDGGLSSSAKAGIIAASVIAGLGALGAAAVLLLRYRRKKDGEESHPMLPPQKLEALGGPGGEFSAVPTDEEVQALESRDKKPGSIDADAEQDQQEDWPRDAKWRPSQTPEYQPITPGGFNWESPYVTDPNWEERPRSQPEEHWSQPPPTAHSHRSFAQSRVYELEAEQVPFEMAGSEVGPVEMAGEVPTLVTPVHPPGSGQAYSGAGWGPGK